MLTANTSFLKCGRFRLTDRVTNRQTDLPVPFVESKSNRCGTVGDHKAQDLSRDAGHANTQDPAGRLVEVWYPARLG